MGLRPDCQCAVVSLWLGCYSKTDFDEQAEIVLVKEHESLFFFFLICGCKFASIRLQICLAWDDYFWMSFCLGLLGPSGPHNSEPIEKAAEWRRQWKETLFLLVFGVQSLDAFRNSMHTTAIFLPYRNLNICLATLASGLSLPSHVT